MSSKRVIKAAHLVVGSSPVTIEGGEAAAACAETAAAADAGLWEADSGAPAEEELASRLVRQARTEAECLLAAAREQAAALCDEARREGFAAGYQEGEEQGRAAAQAQVEAELRALVEQARQVLAEALAARARIVEASRDDVLKVVRKVAEKVIRAEVKLDPAVVERAIEAALRHVAENSRILVRVHPEDLARARAGVPHFLRYFTPSTVLEVCADPRVAQGGCLVETQGGNIDARLETQLDELLSCLEEGRHGT